MDKSALKITADGSHTLYVKELDETYHSIHGAIQEAKHVFIDAGFKHVKKERLKILEVGFGTGLNAFLTLQESQSTNKHVDYVGIEAYPLQKSIVTELNYLKELEATEEEVRWFYQLHQCDWEVYQTITNQLYLKKVQTDINTFITDEQFDIIYFDAFGPRVQPDMWEQTVFEKMFNLLSEGGVLVTYGAKGSVKRTLKTVGFEIESLPGPPGKREMTRAVK